MKPSSILMSSFAALLILISVRESALDFSKTNPTDTIVAPIAVIHKKTPDAKVPFMAMLHKTSLAEPYIQNVIGDFSYLKFNVPDFVTTEAGYAGISYEAELAFLKFKVSDYIETEIGVMPEESDCNYLKFDVSTYIVSPYDNEELPDFNFDYLKFDVQKYGHGDSIGEINELPEDDNQ